LLIVFPFDLRILAAFGIFSNARSCSTNDNRHERQLKRAAYALNGQRSGLPIPAHDLAEVAVAQSGQFIDLAM
jgi:hypothetical protein